MYKRSESEQRKGRKRRRLPVRGRFILIGIFAVGLLLMGAGKSMGAAVPNLLSVKVTSAQSQKGVENMAAPVTPEAAPAAASSADDWRMILVNPWNPIPADYKVKLTELKNGHSVDERCYPDLQTMMDDCRAAGLSPVICSSYRTQNKQETLFNNKVNKLVAKGYSQENARTEAGKSVAVPGTSEHQLGLAVDIVDVSNQNLDENQEKTAVQKWLMKNSWKYGFILRYPNDKSDITGIIYEPWHYRYVGKEAAKAIYEQGICLEEYLKK